MTNFGYVTLLVAFFLCGCGGGGAGQSSTTLISSSSANASSSSNSSQTTETIVSTWSLDARDPEDLGGAKEDVSAILDHIFQDAATQSV